MRILASRRAPLANSQRTIGRVPSLVPVPHIADSFYRLAPVHFYHHNDYKVYDVLCLGYWGSCRSRYIYTFCVYSPALN